MKYLKKFNEELKSTTYKSAGDKFMQIGHKRRGSELLKHAEEIRLKEEAEAKEIELRKKLDNLKKLQDENKEFGLFDVTITRGWSNRKEIYSGKFYLKMCLEADWFSDMRIDWMYDGMQDVIGISMEFALIPSDIDTLDFFENSGDPDIEYLVYNHMYNSEIWSNRLWITLLGSDLEPKGKISSHFEDRDGYNFYFNSRKDAIRFKKLLYDTFSGKNNWSSSTRTNKTIAQTFKENIILTDKEWKDLLMNNYLINAKYKNYDLDDPDFQEKLKDKSETWPKTPFTEDICNKSIESIKDMKLNGLYID